MSRYYQHDSLFEQDFEDVVIENDEYDIPTVSTGKKFTKRQQKARLKRMEKNREKYIAQKDAKEAAKHDEKKQLKTKHFEKVKATEKLKSDKNMDGQSPNKIISFKDIAKQKRINNLKNKKESARHSRGGMKGGKGGK